MSIDIYSRRSIIKLTKEIKHFPKEEKDMIKYYVFDEESEIWSEAFDTREDAENELLEQNQHCYSLDAEVIEVDEY